MNWQLCLSCLKCGKYPVLISKYFFFFTFTSFITGIFFCIILSETFYENIQAIGMTEFAFPQ